jgi:hypothetical protein
MNMKIYCILMVSLISTIPLTVSADDSSKTYLSAGMLYITDKGLDVLKGTGVTVDDNDTIANFSLGYIVSPSLSFEGGILSSGEVTASLPTGDSGTLYGKAYSVSGTVTVKAKTDNAYLLGLKFSGGSDPLSINIKAGQLFWDVDYIATGSGTITYGGTAYSGSSSAKFKTVDGNDLYFGIGASYALSNNSSIDLGLTSYEINNGGITGYSLSWVRNF